jgi:hypothetical protein
MTTTVRRWALYKAQQGAYLSDLEQLHASISLPSTFKMIWSLRSFGALSVGLVFVWSFYYLGSQACKLEYRLTVALPRSKMGLAWPKADYPSKLISGSGIDGKLLVQNMNENLISTAYYTEVSRKDHKPYDLWGNPLVPVIEDVPFLSQDDWSRVDSPEHASYAAYAGPELYTRSLWSQWGFPNPGFGYDSSHQYLGEFIFSTNYTLVSCDPPKLDKFELFPNETLPGADTAIRLVESDRLRDANGRPTSPRQLELWGRWNVGLADANAAAMPNGSVVSLCHLTQSFIEAKTICDIPGCSSRDVRYSPLHNGTVASTPFDDDAFAAYFFDNLLNATGPPQVRESEIIKSPTTVSWLIGLSNAVMTSYEQGSANATFGGDTVNGIASTARGLTKLINTYYAASQNHANSCASGDDKQFPEFCAYTTVKGAIYDPQFLLSIPWAIIDFLSCLVLFLAAVFSFWLRRKTLAPDIFGFVSSLTRENPHFALETGDGSTLSGLERARLLGKVKVKIGDVAGDREEVGRIGLSHVADGYEAKRLQKERKYA